MNYAPATTSARTRTRTLSARFDLVLVGCSILLGLIGVVMIYSATKGKLALAGEDPRYFLKRQAIFLVIGVLVMLAMTLFDYRRLEQISTVLYIGILVALVAVLATPAQHGAQRWFPLGPIQLQPSEFATLVLIIAIATYCSRRPEGLEFRDLVRMVLMAGLPILMVFKQPDLGTAIVMSVILLVMLAVAGMPGRYLVLLIVGAVVLVLFAINVGILQQVPDRPPDQLHLAQRVEPGGHLQRGPGQRGHRPRRCLRPGPVRGHPDQPGLRSRTADRLHLLRRGGADRLRGGHGAAGHLRRGGLPHPPRRPDGPGRPRPTPVHRHLRAYWCSPSSRTWA